jgi:curved DNA-binding protein
MDHYTTLGVSKTASPEEIKKAYRKLASQHHPDKGGDTVMFQKIEEAYRTLSDPNLKAQYDNPAPGPGGFPGGFHFHSDQFNIHSIFEQMFGQQNFGPQNRSNKQIFRTILNVTLDDVYYGKTKLLKIQTQKGMSVINVEIPKGIPDNGQVKYDNLIENAILLVEFRVSPDLKFERRGNDLVCNHQISVLDLIVGSIFEFTTMSGKTLEVNIAPKTQPYMQLKIPGHGMPIYGSHVFGDQIILLKPYMPSIIDKDITDSILRCKNTINNQKETE